MSADKCTLLLLDKQDGHLHREKEETGSRVISYNIKYKPDP